MTETKFTPGPWRLYGAVVRGKSREGHERPVCELYRKIAVDPETIANAHLIAAAPEMVEALRPDWALALHRFLAAEYAAAPDSGQAVTADVRPHFEALCEFIASRAVALSKALGNGG